MNAFSPINPTSIVLKIRQVAESCWWVYREELSMGEFRNTLARVVFIGDSREEAQDWVQQQQEEACSFVLSAN